jgi:hypothetical protein
LADEGPAVALFLVRRFTLTKEGRLASLFDSESFAAMACYFRGSFDLRPQVLRERLALVRGFDIGTLFPTLLPRSGLIYTYILPK